MNCHFRRSLVFLILIILISGVLFLAGLGNRGLWSPDETRYIAVSKEIIESGDWVSLRRNGEIYAQKPPVFFWLMAISSLLLRGFSEFSARLPSALAGIGGAIITYLFALRLFNERIAALSSLILISSIAYLAAARWVILDVVSTFFILSSIYLLYIGFNRSDLRFRVYLPAFVLMAVGTLTKGPIGIILPLLVMGSYAFHKKEMRSLFGKELFAGFILFILMVAVWLIPACIKGGQAYTKELLLRQIFGRFLEAFDHREPFYFYLIRFPLGFMPWIVFFPSAVVFFVKHKRSEDSVKFIFLWFISIFLFFTLSKSKNDLYILPVYPAVSMAIAYYLDSNKKSPRFILWPFILMIMLNTILTHFIFPVIDRYKSPKYFSHKIARYVKEEDKLVAFKMNPVYWLYYLNRRYLKELDTYEDLDAYLRSNERVFCIIENKDYEGFTRFHKTAVYPLEKEDVYGRKKVFALISNKDK